MVFPLSDPSLNIEKINEEGEILDIQILKGKTLLVYWNLLKNPDPVGVRELQRQLDFSSPSLVTYHLTKLESIQLIEKTKNGQYFVIRKADIAELRDLIVFRKLNKTFTLPRVLMYAIIFSLLYVFYIPIFFIFDSAIVTNSVIFANIFAILGITFLWYETYKAYKGLPFN